MIEIHTARDCCGCGACSQICPKNCIRMEPDEEGFFYPHADKATCIDCGLCEKSCPILRSETGGTIRQDSYAAYHRDDAIRQSSSSGGIFSALAERVLQNEGVVFGAAFDDDLLVHHIGVERLEDLEKLRGSKYLQSRTEDSYCKAKAALDAGRPVLYSGTGCQIAGLRAFLKKDYPELLAVDVLCHGVPTQKLWKHYLAWQEREYGGAVWQAFFRRKDPGWKTFSMSLAFSNDTAYQRTFREDPYLQLFLKNICLRPSCHDCRFKAVRSQADITLGDCWGSEKALPDMDDDKGLSVVFVHTEKGEAAFEQIKKELVVRKVDVEIVQQSMVYSSVAPHPHRGRFFAALNKGASIAQLSALLKLSLPERAIRKIKRILK